LTLSEIEEEEKFAAVTGATTQRQHQQEESFPRTNGSDQMTYQSPTDNQLVSSFTVKAAGLNKLSDSKSVENFSVGLRESSM